MRPWVGIRVGAIVAGPLGPLLGTLTLRLRDIFAAVMACFVGIALPFVFFIEFPHSNFQDLPRLHLVVYGVLVILVMGFSGLYNWAAEKVRALLSKS